MAAKFPADLTRDSDWTKFTLISVLTILLPTLCFQLWRRALEIGISKYPLVDKSLGTFSERRENYLKHGVEYFIKASTKFKDSPWRVTTNDGETLVLPIRYIDELRSQSEHVASGSASNKKTFETKHLGITPDNPLMAHIVKADLTHNLTRITETIAPAIVQAVRDEVGPCENWQQLSVYSVILNIVAIVSGHAFVGPELAQRKEYLHSSKYFTVDVFKAIGVLRRWPKWMRGIAKSWIPDIKAVEEHRQSVHNLLIPAIRERRARIVKGEDVPDDFITWMVRKADKFDVKNDKELAEMQLILGLAATHTTTMTVTQILYDIVGHCPEVISDLRRDIHSALTASGGVMTAQALYNMKLLDSVMRESQRMNPFNVVRMQRVTLKPIRFSDGTTVPAGVDLAIPAIVPLRDPETYMNPDLFDPYRFAQLRSGQAKDLLGYDNKEVYQFISVAKENLGFGYGKRACPGRFFAANEIKMICAQVLMNYDIKMPDGCKDRHENILKGWSITPDPTKMIMIKEALGKR